MGQKRWVLPRADELADDAGATEFCVLLDEGTYTAAAEGALLLRPLLGWRRAELAQIVAE